jgi:hypothetical protein
MTTTKKAAVAAEKAKAKAMALLAEMVADGEPRIMCIGKVRPLTWLLKHGYVRLTKDEDGFSVYVPVTEV